MAPSRSAVLVTLTLEQKQKLTLLAEYRRTSPDALATYLIEVWLSDQGTRELMRHLVAPPPPEGRPRSRTRAELAGQLSVDDALRDVS